MDEQLIKVGDYLDIFNDVLGINIEEKEIYRSKGLPTHIVKRKHYKVLKYIDYIPEIIASPDYIGINPNENGILYVSTMHDIQEGKIQKRLHSGRLKQFIVDNNENQ